MKTNENFSDLISILEDKTNLTYVKILFITKLSYDSINLKDPSDYNDFVSIRCCTKNTKIKENYNSEYEAPYYTLEKNHDDFCIYNNSNDCVKNITFEYSCNKKIIRSKVSNVYYKLTVQEYETYIKPVIDKIISKNSMVYQAMTVSAINKNDNKQHILKSGGIFDVANALTEYIETSWIMLIKPISIGVNASGIYINYQAPKSYVVHTNTPHENERFNEVKMTIINNNIIKNGYCDIPCNTFSNDPSYSYCYFHYETNLVKLIPSTYKNKAALSFLTEQAIPSVIEIESQNQNAIKKTFKVYVKFVKGFKAPSKIASQFDYLQMINYFETHMKDYVAAGNMIDPTKMFSSDKFNTYYMNEVYILKSELPNTYLQKTDRELMIHVKKSKTTIYAVSTINDINRYAAFSISEKNLLDAYKEVLPEDQFKAMYVKYSLT